MAQVALQTGMWGYGNAERTQVYAVRNVTTGDTMDVSNDFSSVRFAVWICTTTPKQGALTVAGTTVTIGTAGVSQDAGYVMVFGGAN